MVKRPDAVMNSMLSISGASKLEEIPDGGLQAWLQVFGAFFLWFNSWGLTNAFGVFQTYYTTKFRHEDASNISLIGSIQPFLLIFVGFLAGPMWDAGYFKSMLWTGTILTILGYFMISLCDKYWQVMLAQGVLVGIGSGFIFLISVAIIPQYFSRHKALANGVAAAGAGLGGVIYPIAFRKLLQRLSFGWSVRVLAFIILGTSLIPIAVLRVRYQPSTKRSLRFDYTQFYKDKPYGLWTLATFFTIGSQYIPAFYIQDYAQQKKITNPEMAAYLLPMLNAASIPGRIIPNLLADKIGPLNVLIPGLAICSVLAFCWIAVDSLASAIVFVLLYGFCIGLVLSLPATAVISLTSDLSTVGARMGNAFALTGLGLLFGTPTAGAILQSTSFLGVQIFGGSLLAIASVGILIARTSKTGWKVKIKA